MRLFIKIKDGQPFEHPIGEENFRSAFPDVDIDNLSLEFARFERVRIPQISVYEVYEGVSYEWKDGIVRDSHHVRSMTDQEKISKQNKVKEQWHQNGFPTWIFQEDTCSFVPPIAYPIDGRSYKWDDESVSWLEMAR